MMMTTYGNNKLQTFASSCVNNITKFIPIITSLKGYLYPFKDILLVPNWHFTIYSSLLMVEYCIFSSKTFVHYLFTFLVLNKFIIFCKKKVDKFTTTSNMSPDAFFNENKYFHPFSTALRYSYFFKMGKRATSKKLKCIFVLVARSSFCVLHCDPRECI